jgi:hypothetical protein
VCMTSFGHRGGSSPQGHAYAGGMTSQFAKSWSHACRTPADQMDQMSASRAAQVLPLFIAAMPINMECRCTHRDPALRRELSPLVGLSGIRHRERTGLTEWARVVA